MGQFSEQYGKYHFTVQYSQEAGTLTWQADVVRQGRLVATRGGKLHAKEGQVPFGDDDVRAAVLDSIDKWQEYRQPGEDTPYTGFD
jgi:hypothetical protein